MDTITQALLGAASARACAGHKLGRKAAVWGAVSAALPDLDFLSVIVGGPWAGMLHHRGVSHALWFGPVVGSLLGYLLWRLQRRSSKGIGGASPPDGVEKGHLGAPGMLRWWALAMAVSMLSHPLLDWCTTYGTQLLAPFSRHRYAIDAIGIIDPSYSLILVFGLWFGRKEVTKMKAAGVAVVLSTAYLGAGLWLNERAERYALADLSRQGVVVEEVHAYPTLFQLFLRRVTARQGKRWHVAWISMWAPRPPIWTSFTEAPDPLITRTRSFEEGALFEWFSQGRTMARVRTEGIERIVEIEDMRYGTAAAPSRSMWGIRARFDADGKLLAPVSRYRNPMPGGVRRGLRELMRAAFPPAE